MKNNKPMTTKEKIQGFVFIIFLCFGIYIWSSYGKSKTVYDQINKLEPWQAQQAVDNMSPQHINYLVEYYVANDKSGIDLAAEIEKNIGYGVTLPYDISNAYKDLIESIGDHIYNYKYNDDYITSLAYYKRYYKLLQERASGHKFVNGKAVIDNSVEPYHHQAELPDVGRDALKGVEIPS